MASRRAARAGRSRELKRKEEDSRGKAHPNKLRSDSVLQLCPREDRCTNSHCRDAHSQQELESWWEDLRSVSRSYRPDHHQFKLCKFPEPDEGEPRTVCRGFDCRFAHSEEELRMWKRGRKERRHLHVHVLSMSASINSHLSTHSRVRMLQEDSRLALCSYLPKCRRGNCCYYAHSNEELRSWWTEVSGMIREYQPKYHRLQLCTVVKESEATRVCRNGGKCKYAHSQEELSVWEKSLPFRQPCAGKMMELCRHGSECEYYQDDGNCRYAHNEMELQAWKKEHSKIYMESDSSIPERCTYTLPVPTCQLGITCPYAHTDQEREKLMKKLATYDDTVPRPVPRADKLLPYQMCENHRDKTKCFAGKCMYGRQCKSAHSKAELDSWERQRREESAKGSAVSRAQDAEESHSPMLGPTEATHTLDPFLTSLMDYQRKFTDQLAGVLRGIVIRASQDKRIKIGAFIDHNRKKIDLSTLEGRECASLLDTQYLLGYLQRNCEVMAKHLGLKEAYLSGVVCDLLEVRNVLAHGLYKKGSSRGDGGDDGDGSDEERGKTDKFIQRVLDFIKHIISNQDKGHDDNNDEDDDDEDEDDDDDDDDIVPDDDDNSADELRYTDNHTHIDDLEKGYHVLLSLYGTFKDFVLYQKQSRAQVKSYSTMTPDQQSQAGSEALGALQQLLGMEKDHPGEVTRYIVTCVRSRFKDLPS